MASLPQLSTGQLQLLALARAILQDQVLNGQPSTPDSPSGRGRVMPILLLDEATSSLDPATESAMRGIIHEEFTERGHTVIAITHRLNGVAETMRAGQDVVALLSQGKVDKIGDAEHVLGTLLSLK